MADLATLSRRVQLGVEGTEGTEVDANKRMPNLRLSLEPQQNFTTYKATGSRFTTSVVPGWEYTQGSYEGPISFGEIVYPLSSIANYAAPAGTTDKTWTFTPSLTAVNTTKSYTLEIGNSLQADQVLGMFFNGITMTFSPDTAEMSGSFMGYRILPIAAITSAGVTDVENVVAHAHRTEVYYASTFAGLASGATKLNRAFLAEVTLEDMYGTFRAMNAATTGYTARMETVPNAKLNLTLGAEYSGSDFTEPITLANARAGAINYIRIKTDTGTNYITGSIPWSLTIDMAVRVTAAVSLGEQDDMLKNVTWECDLVEDSTSGKAIEITVVNATAAL